MDPVIGGAQTGLRRALIITLVALLAFAVLAVVPAAHAQTAEGPAIDLEKSTNGEDADAPPGPTVRVEAPITWTYSVTNTGDVPLTNIAVTDDNADGQPITCPGTTLGVGESMECSATSVSWWTRFREEHANTATVTATAGETELSDQDSSHYTAQLFCPIPTDGDDIVIPIFNLDASGRRGFMLGNGLTPDTVPTTAAMPAGTYDVKLASYDAHIVKGDQGQSFEQYIVQLDNGWQSSPTPDLAGNDDIAWWTVDTATTIPAGGTNLTAVHVGPVGATESVNALCVVFDPVVYDLGIAKTSTSHPNPDVALVGETIVYEITVTNTGNAPLTNVAVSDALLADLDCGTIPDPLAAGASFPCTGSHVATQADGAAGKVDNTATATSTETGPADASYQVPVALPGISIDKAEDLQVIESGASAVWTITVTNTTDVDLINVVVTDPLAPECDRTIGDLAAGAQESYQCSLDNVTEGFTNVASVVGTDENQNQVTDTDDAEVQIFEVGASGRVGDFVWNDLNADGKQDSGEPGIKGAVVKLTNLDTGVTTTQTTNADGRYLFSALEAGNYTGALDLTTVSGDLTTPGSFTFVLPDGGQNLDVDFGVVDTLPDTGLDTEQTGLLGLLLALFGLVVLVATRRRRLPVEA